MSSISLKEPAVAASIGTPALNAVIAEVQSYMRCADLVLLKNAADENFLIKLLLIGISGGREEDVRDPTLFFDELHSQGNRQVCQYQFKRNDIVWTCRDCQADETCVLCNECFQGSDHTGHDVYFYHSQVGGCCDCGDVNAWSPEGFCSKHGKATADPLEHVAPDIKTIATEILGVLSHEMALFCEERKGCFDFDSSDFFERFQESQILKREGDKEGGGEGPAAHPIAAPFFSLTTAAALLDISHSDGDVDLNSEDFSDSHYEDSSAAGTGTGVLDSEGDLLCLHDDDINTPDKIIVDLLSVGMSVEEASRIRAEAITIGSSTFLPSMNQSLLPQSIVSAGNRMTIRLTARVKKRLTPSMTRFLLLKRAACALRDLGLKVGIVTQAMLSREDRARIALSWLTDFSQINDGMCRMVSLSLSVDILLRILKVFHHLPKTISGPLHNLFLSQMADKMFKKNLAIAYAEGYVYFTKSYGLGHGTTENSIFSLSVQFLNRDFLVLEIVDYHNFFVNVCQSIENMLATACEGHGRASEESPDRSQDNSKGATRPLDHPVLTHRRYNPMFADLKVIFAIPGMSRRFLASTMPIFMRILDRFQYMHPQCRETQQHVMYDSVEWMTAFNLYLCIGNLFDWLNNWLDDPSSATHALFSVGTDESLTIMQQDVGAQTCSSSSSSSCSVMDVADSDQHLHVASGVESETSTRQMLQGTETWEKNSLPSMIAVLHSALHGVLAWQARHVSRDDLPCDSQQRIDHRTSSLVPTLNLPTLPAAFSFHLPLHRFLSSIISEASKYPAHTDALLAIQRCLPQLISDADSAFDDAEHGGSNSSNNLFDSRETAVRKLGASNQLAALIDYPIRSSLLGAQIRAGLWRKNGAAVRDQLPNYMDVPYCKVLKDLDILLIQFCGSKYGANRLVCHVFERYGVRGYLAHWCDSDSRRSSGDGEGERERHVLTDDSTDSMGEAEEDSSDMHPFLFDSPPSTQDCVPDDIAFLPALADEALLLLINIVSEIPPPPSSNPLSNAIVAVKRELIYFLAGKKSNHATFSQMYEHVSYCGMEFTKIGSVALEQVINYIADKKKSSALDPPFFVLKKEMWKHYDPSAPHVARRMHQNAAEDRPKNTAPTPFCPPPQTSHAVFSSLRAQIVFEPLLLHSLRNLVLCAAAARTPHTSYAAVRTWDLDCGGVVLNRALHLLTIALHLVDQDQVNALEQKTNADVEENAKRVSNLLDLTSSGHTADVTSHNLNGTMGLTSTLAAFLLQEPVSTVADNTRGSTPSAALPHFLCALSDLEEVLDPTHEHVQKSSLSWILLRCEKLNPSCKSYSQSRRLGKGESREVSMEEKKRKARERAMKAMKASASKFTAHITDEENTKKKEKGNDVPADPEWESGNMNGRKEDMKQVGEGGGDASLVAMGSDDEGAVQDGEISRTVCIVCQAEEEESCQGQGQGLCRQSPKIGFLAFSQCSHAAMRGSQDGPPAIRLAADFESCEGNVGEIHLSFCGHAMHYSCFDSYYASMLGRDKSHTDMMLDTDRGHFDCPLCKRLSNLLVPAPAPVPLPLSRNENASMGVGEGLMKAEEGERLIERKRKTEGIMDVPESTSSKKSHRPETMSAVSNWMDDSIPDSPHDHEAVHQPAGRRDSLLLSPAGEVSGVGSSSSSSGDSYSERCAPALESSSDSTEVSLPQWVTWICQPHLVTRAMSRTTHPDEKEEVPSKSNFHRHRRSDHASKARESDGRDGTDRLNLPEGAVAEGGNEVREKKGYDTSSSELQPGHEESNGMNDDEVCVEMTGEESGQSGEDAEGDDVWCDVCDLSALDVHRGEDAEEGDIVDEIPPDQREDDSESRLQWSWEKEGLGKTGDVFYDNNGTADGNLDYDVGMSESDFYDWENHGFFRSVITNPYGAVDARDHRHFHRFKILSILICHLTRRKYNEERKATLEFWSRFLIGFCEPKLGATDSLEWHNKFEDNRRNLLKSAATLFDVRNFDDAAVKRDGDNVAERLLVHLYFGAAQVKHIETVLSGIAFSFSMDEVESSRVGIEKGFPRMRLLDAAISGVGSCLRCFRGYSMVLRSLQSSLKGTEETAANREDSAGIPDSDHWVVEEVEIVSGNHREVQTGKTGSAADPVGKINESDRDGGTIVASDSGTWLDKSHLPLLARPLLDTIVLLMAVSHPSVIAETEQEGIVPETVSTSMAASSSGAYSSEQQESLRKEMIGEVLMSREEESGSVEEAVSDASTLQRETSSFEDIPCAAASAVRWLCVAHLLQCIITHSSQHDLPGGCEETNSTHTSTATSSDPQPNSWAAGGIFREMVTLAARSRPSLRSRTLSPSSVDEGFMRGVLERWNSFLLVVAHMLRICRPDLIDILRPQVKEPKAQTKCPHPHAEDQDVSSSSSRLSDESLSAAMEAVGLETLLRDSAEATNDRSQNALWAEVTTAAARWLRALDDRTSESQATLDPLKPGAFGPSVSRIDRHALASSKSAAAVTSGDRDVKDLRAESVRAIANYIPHLNRAVQRSYPFLSKPRLFPLPSSYTQLHSQLTAMGGYSFPAMCLICGAVMDANGRGKCAAHSKICNKDAGIVFLLQDCTVLLSIGPRCAYFPTPYVDDYGEKHKHCRGKPLHLDPKRLEILRKLWASHGVGNEVYQKRSTSSRVVINGHY